MNTMLMIGRMVGPENFSQMRQVYKALQANKAGTYSAHFVFDSASRDAFMKMANTSDELSESLAKAMPNTSSDKAKHILDIVIQKFNAEPLLNVLREKHSLDLGIFVIPFERKVAKLNNNASAAISMSSLTRVGEDIVQEGSAKVLTNNAGKKVRFNVKGESGAKIDTEATFSNINAARAEKFDMEDFIDDIPNIVKYSETDGVGNIQAELKTDGLIKDARLNYSMPSEIFDSMVKQATDGEVKKFGDFLSIATKKHNAVDELDIEALLKDVRKQVDEEMRSDIDLNWN